MEGFRIAPLITIRDMRYGPVNQMDGNVRIAGKSLSIPYSSVRRVGHGGRTEIERITPMFVRGVDR